MRRLAFFVLAAAFVLSTGLEAQMPEVPPGKWWKRPALVNALGLTAEQQAKLEEIFGKNRRGFIDLKADVERRQVDVEELFAKKDSDPKKVAAAVDSLEEARLRLRKAATLMILEMKGVLTDVQWQAILDRREEWRRQRMQEHRGPRPGRAPGSGSAKDDN